MAMSHEPCEEAVISNVMWTYANLMGERNPHITEMVLK
jgi:hypothetical protein